MLLFDIVSVQNWTRRRFFALRADNARRARLFLGEKRRRDPMSIHTPMPFEQRLYSSSSFELAKLYWQSARFVSERSEVRVLQPAPAPRNSARFAKWPRHRSYTPTFPGSNPGAGTTILLARGHPGRVLSARPSQPRARISRSSKAEPPADNGETADRYRAGGPIGPGAFQPEPVGHRPFKPLAMRFDPSRVLHAWADNHARLAQVAERRPLKSEARGSTPRSCSTAAWPATHLARRTLCPRVETGSIPVQAAKQKPALPLQQLHNRKGGSRCIPIRSQRSCSTPTSGR